VLLARIVGKYKIAPPADEANEWKRLPGETGGDRRERIYKVIGGRHQLTRFWFGKLIATCLAELSQPPHRITLTPAWPLNVAFVARELSALPLFVVTHKFMSRFSFLNGVHSS